MKYADARAWIKTGDVIAYTHRGVRCWGDFLIFLERLFCRSEYAHVALAWVICGRVFLLEAVASGVRIYPLSMKLPFFLLTGKGLSDERLEFALSKIGQPYSDLEGIRAFFGKNDATNADWQCAEYVAAVLGLPCQATPTAVVNHLLDNGSTMTGIQP